LTRAEEPQSSQPEPAEELMEESQPDPSDLQEPVKNVEAGVKEPETGSGGEDVE